MATNIKQIFNTLSEKNFFTFSYIENSSSESPSSECFIPPPTVASCAHSFSVLPSHHLDRFRRGIFEYCRNETTPLEIMQSSMAGDVHFMQALEENKPVRALVRALNRLRGALPRIFALSVMRNNPEPDPDDDTDVVENRMDDFRKLAEVVWQKNAPSQYGSEIISFNTIKDTFNTSVEEVSMFSIAIQAVPFLDHLSSDNLKHFLAPVSGHEEERKRLFAGRSNEAIPPSRCKRRWPGELLPPGCVEPSFSAENNDCLDAGSQKFRL